MKLASISKSSFTFNQDASRDQQKYQHQARNKRRQQQRWRRKCNRRFFFWQQHTYSTLRNQNNFLWKDENVCQQIIKPITVVAGSSMASRLIEHNLQTPRNIVKLNFESGCNCAKMLRWLSSTEGRQFMCGASRLILILGTNDLHVVGAKKTIDRIKETVESIRHLLPRVEIVWQLLQWRTKATRYLFSDSDVLQEIAKCNVMLLDLAHTLRFQTIDPALTRGHICHDNLHPNNNGSRTIEKCIRSFLEQQREIIYSSFQN